MTEKQKILENVFDLKEFRLGQGEIIDSVLDPTNEGILSVLPTGGGKSLLYQLPSQMIDGLTVVISPLISLMMDQVRILKQKGISAECINSSLKDSEKQTIWNKFIHDELKLLYIAPERLTNEVFVNALKRKKIGLFAVDEAHCISTWGHDFRPHYRLLGDAIDYFEPERVIALTATATKRVQKDICEQLHIPNARKFIKGFYRDDLRLCINKCSKNDRVELLMRQVEKYVKDGVKTGIIYSPTRTATDSLRDDLKRIGIKAFAYHAGLSNDERTKIQKNWFAQGGILVATVAFGMGIDKPDVRFVLHASMPGSIENYYQEIGRASRDGKGADCIMFTDPKEDARLQRFLIDLSYPSEENILKFWKWCCFMSDPDGCLYLTQKEMGEKCSIVPKYFISGCISKLKEYGLIETIGRGDYLIRKDLTIQKQFNFKEHNAKRYAKLDILDEIVDFVNNDKYCRMLHILEYFDDHSRQEECNKCDYCDEN